MPGTQELTRRIKSVKSTRKVTRAMQMVSAAKMRKSQNATLASRTFAGLAWELIHSLGGIALHDDISSLKQFPDAEKIGIVIISSNRGQVGSFNLNLINKVREIERAEPQLLSELVVMGRKIKESALRMHKPILAEFPKADNTIGVSDIFPLATLLTDAYATGNYRKIVIVYNHFVSTLVQKPTIKQLFPMVIDESALDTTAHTSENTLYEPSPRDVLKHLLPRIIESQLYQSILENDASEHSARMVMMKNATEAAGDIISDLTLTFNQLRQSKITTELSEITAGKIALEDKA